MKSEPLREAAGWAIESVIVQPDETDLPLLKRRWCDALYWLGDARRDPTAFSALVRYGMCLDVLTKGGKARKITRMVADMLGRDPKDQLLTDGSSVRAAVGDIYDKGRSQLGHGGRPALLEDLPIERSTTDQVATLALFLYVMRLRAYQGPDDVDAFLAALPALTASAK